MQPRMKTLITTTLTLLLASCTDTDRVEAKPSPAASTTAVAQTEQPLLYFNISDDANSPSFLHLSEIEDQGDNHYLVARTDLFGRGARDGYGLGTIWEVDCDNGRMKVIRAARLSPGDEEARIVDMASEWGRPANQAGRMMLDLVCVGEAQLERSRVFQGDMRAYSARFWGR